ncbi:MAG: esterase-like activity of phytase family protein, partial [Bacillota bacterium]
GWTAEKAEGLTVLNDRRTIAIVNDNDFGLTMQVSDKLNGGQTEIGKYQMTAPKSFTYEQKPAQPKFKAAPVSPEDSRTYLWLVKLPVDRLAF